jgi:hypothetical protein
MTPEESHEWIQRMLAAQDVAESQSATEAAPEEEAERAEEDFVSRSG